MGWPRSLIKFIPLEVNFPTELKRFCGRVARKSFVFLLVFSLILQSFIFNLKPVNSASSPWTQTDWSGGSGQTNWSDTTKFDSSSNVTTSTAGQVTLEATSNWYNTSWKYRRKITFDNSAQAENLVNFPVLVKLDSTRIDYSKTQDSGQDIRFTDSDGTTLLSYEIEKWDETGNSFVWVKVPQIDASSSTDYIYMYYGNSSATDGQAATSVWDSNYKAVWHLKEDPSGAAPQMRDSTANATHGTSNGNMTSADQINAQINGGLDFDGIDDVVNFTSMNLGTSNTVEMWVNYRDPGDGVLIGKINGNYAMYVDGPANTNRIYYNPGAGEGYVSVVHNGLTSGTFYYLAVVRDGVSVKFYKNGNQLDNVQTLGSNTDLNLSSIGAHYESNSFFADFQTDEIRISNTARSAAWIAASYKSESDTFNTFASEESVYSTTPGTLTSSIFDTELTAATAWGNLTYTATTPTNTSVSVKVRTSNSSSMSGATDFSSCTAVTNGSDISSNSCVTDGHRYIQYQLTLANTDSISTPTFQDISIAFSSSDSSPPSISLTAYSPDPATDTTPTLSGTASEESGTVSNVQFQMDSTSGSWSSCTADDGAFDEATEAFSCTPSTALSDGSHTMYVRATDSNSNTTASGSESSDAFTIDATAPTSIDLDSPGDNSYTNNERPTFKWKATTDATAGLSKYALEIDNPSLSSANPSGDFTIDDIPTSRTTDYETNKYLVHYENFSDSDSTNNYISVYTKSSSEWSTDSNSGQNDGKLREGKVSWKVKAVDNAGNETSSSRTLFVDRTNPKVEFTQVNDTPFSSRNFSTTDKTPTIYGKITDPLAGGDSSQLQDENGPKVASGPKQVEIKVEKKEGLGYKLHTLYTINMDKPWYTCDGMEVSDNTKQKCDKYLPFEYTPGQALDLGTYRITISGKDKAGNTSNEATLTLNITTLENILTPQEREALEEESSFAPPGGASEGQGKEKVKEELEITKPVAPSALEKTGAQISQISKNILNTMGNLISGIFNTIDKGLKSTINKTGEALAFVGEKIGQATTFLAQGIGNAAKGIGKGYSQLANNAPGVTKTILTGIGNGVSTAATSIGNTTQTIANASKTAIQKTTKGISDIAFKVGEKTQDVSDIAGFAIVKFGYLFVNEPTKITNVQVQTISPTSVRISWETNHPANGKVNWGLDKTYPFEVQSEKRVTHHEFTLTDLQPDTLYYFEVMSHNKNYVYDANREFRTPALSGSTE